MYLVIDVGNTNIVAGVYSSKPGDTSVITTFRLTTPLNMTTDELAVSFKNMLHFNKIDASKLKGAIFSSVVPSINHNITKMMNVYFNIDIISLSRQDIKGLTIHYNHPDEVGMDRLINSKAAVKLFGVPALIIDFGTAVTIDVVDASSRYCGGLIMPGLAIALNALIQNTSKLPNVELDLPKQIIGNSTKESMQNGIYFLYKMGLDKIIDEIKQTHFAKKKTTVIATGGLSHFIAHDLPIVDTIEPDLSLIGLKIILDELKN